MITPSYVRTMTAYNAETNSRLYTAASRLTEMERRADGGAYFRSIHGTLVHLLWGDWTWMSRFDGWLKPAMGAKDSPSMIDDFDELSEQRVKADRDMQNWAGRVTREWLEENMILVQRCAAARDANTARVSRDASPQPSNPSSGSGSGHAHRLRGSVRPTLTFFSWLSWHSSGGTFVLLSVAEFLISVLGAQRVLLESELSVS